MIKIDRSKMLEQLGNIDILEPLRKSLNGISIYKIEGANKVLTTTQNWNIK